MKIIFTDALNGTQMSQKSIPGKCDTSISHRRKHETTAHRIKRAINHKRIWKSGLWGSKGCGPHSSSRPRLPSPCPSTHIQRGLRGGRRGMGWKMVARCSVSWLPGRQQAVWVGCRGLQQASSHGYSLKAYSSASFYQTPRLSFCTSPLCEAWGRTAPRGLGSLNPGALSCSEPWFISNRGQERDRGEEREGGRLERQGKEEYSLRSVWRGCPAPRSCGICPPVTDFGRSNRPRLALDCCNR